MAHGGMEIPEFAQNILSRIEALAVRVSAAEGGIISDEEREKSMSISTNQAEKSLSLNHTAPLR